MAVPETPKKSAPIPLKVVIVGGGIGGLAAAIECKQQGFEVVVLESTEEFTHVGLSHHTHPSAISIYSRTRGK